MLNWINKVLGGSGTGGENPAPWVARFKEQLDPIDKEPAGKTRAGLAGDLLAYVVQGEPASALAEAGRYEGVGHALGLFKNHSYAPPDALYQLVETIPDAVLLRWARLLETAAAVYIKDYHFQFAQGTHWPEALLLNSAGRGFVVWSRRPGIADKIGMPQMERLLQLAGLEPSALLVSAFASPADKSYGAPQTLSMVASMPGYAEALQRHVDVLRPLLLAPAPAQRTHMLWLLVQAAPETLARMAPELAELASSGSKQVRAAAEPRLRAAGEAAVDALRGLARDGKPEQRLHALRLLHGMGAEHGDQALLAFARETAGADKAASVRALLAEWDGAASAEAQAVSYEYTVPAIDWNTPLDEGVRTAIERLWGQANLGIVRYNEQMRAHEAQSKASGGRFVFRAQYDTPLSGEELRGLYDHLASGEADTAQPLGQERHLWRHTNSLLPELAATPGMSPALLLKILHFMGLAYDVNGMLQYPAIAALNNLHKLSGRPSLLELGQMMQAQGQNAEGLFRSYCRGWGGLAQKWEREQVWPFFAHHLELLLKNLSPTLLKDHMVERRRVFDAVATLPQPPPTVVNALFDLALSGTKADRGPAQQALANQPGKEARIVAALADGKATTRIVAAQWLTRLRFEPAVPALEAAVAKEKNDQVKGALLDALEAFGQPVEKYLDRAALARDAGKSLAKGLPSDLEWFPWNALPEVRWNDNGEAVPHDSLRWLLVQAVKQKTAEPNAVLRKYCGMFEPRGREMLGQFVLEAWVREDLRPIPPELAQQRAAQQAAAMHAFAQRMPQAAGSSAGRSVEELTATYLRRFIREPAGSASGSKGLLAIAAACAGQRAAPVAGRYLKDWYGQRATQGKALIGMLAWIEHPSATQQLLAIGRRFRTKALQDEAARQAEALAERNNWTMLELADRTIPSAGFDENGELDLSYGERHFSGRLLPDFRTELYNPDGKKIASLPQPREDDDAEAAAESKKTWSAAKKEIAGVVTLQTERLYEALCTARDWAYADWSEYLYRHPVMRHLVQRLVWVEMRDGKAARSFRPLDDGTLSDCEDNQVTLAPEARVRLAHDTLLDAETVRLWQQHLADYAIAPLFQQLGKGIYELPPKRRDDTAIKDFEGHMLESFALRGRALKLGYVRGNPEDGGWYYSYDKRFPTLGLHAIIEFSGSPLPEENRAVALIKLSFSAGGGRWQRNEVALSAVPPILLSECYDDLRSIAAAGSGYDAEWKKKSSP